jgi:hypothetical protein
MPSWKRANPGYDAALFEQGVMCRASKTHTVFLKTIIPTGGATKDHLGEASDDETLNFRASL